MDDLIPEGAMTIALYGRVSTNTPTRSNWIPITPRLCGDKLRSELSWESNLENWAASRFPVCEN